MSGGNVFADLGLPNAAELQAKAALANQIASIVTHRHLTQVEAAGILGTGQPKVSDLLTGRLDGFSIERLIRYLNALDRDVQIIVTPKPRTRARATLKVTGKSRSSRISDVACSAVSGGYRPGKAGRVRSPVRLSRRGQASRMEPRSDRRRPGGVRAAS